MQEAAQNFKSQDMITVSARLAQILAEEVDLLKEMKISKIEALQSEKIFLTNALDAQRKMLEKHPHIRETIPSNDKHDMQEVFSLLEDISQENHRQLLLAREVNHQVVRAIKDVVAENTQSRTYNGAGFTGTAAFSTLSVTLDKVI